MFGSTNQLKKIQKVKISKMTNIPRIISSNISETYEKQFLPKCW